MKNLLIIILLGIAMRGYSQDTILSIVIPPIGHDTVYCWNASPYAGYTQWVDYSLIDSTVYLKFGTSPGDKKPCWADLDGSDSLKLDAIYTAGDTVEGEIYSRYAINKDYFYRYYCYRIWNQYASADSIIYILEE